eukprot:2311348-Pyramimonas_sp.AAC.1
MGDYTDQFYRGKGSTFNVYYKCAANKTWDNPRGCCSVIRSDRWSQLLSRAQEAAGETGQRWYCHYGARYSTSYGACIEFIEEEADPPH